MHGAFEQHLITEMFSCAHLEHQVAHCADQDALVWRHYSAISNNENIGAHALEHAALAVQQQYLVDIWRLCILAGEGRRR